MPTPTNQDLTARETASLIAADKVDGTEVRNREGESLGTIERVMIDKVSGKVAYAVMRFGGVLGLGADRQALPWSLLKYDNAVGGYVLDLEKDQIQKAPRVTGDLGADASDREWRESLHGHYGVRPYWE